MEKFRIKRSDITEAVRKGIEQYNKHNPDGDPRYPMSTYIVHQLCADMETLYMLRTGKRSYPGYKFIAIDE
jgi:hypothetical protein